jgi:hypothetical protein
MAESLEDRNLVQRHFFLPCCNWTHLSSPLPCKGDNGDHWGGATQQWRGSHRVDWQGQLHAQAVKRRIEGSISTIVLQFVFMVI